MRSFLITTFVFFSTCFFSFAKAQNEQEEFNDIVQTLNNYLDGGTNRDSIMFSQAFLPEGQLIFIRNDSLKIISLKDFAAGIPNSRIKQNRISRIDQIQLFGNVAQAKLTIEYPTFFFHDLMLLVKTYKGWKISAKTFYREEKKLTNNTQNK